MVSYEEIMVGTTLSFVCSWNAYIFLKEYKEYSKEKILIIRDQEKTIRLNNMNKCLRYVKLGGHFSKVISISDYNASDSTVSDSSLKSMLYYKNENKPDEGLFYYETTNPVCAERLKHRYYKKINYLS